MHWDGALRSRSVQVGSIPTSMGSSGRATFHNGLSTSSEDAFVGTLAVSIRLAPLPSVQDFFKGWDDARKIVSANLYETSSGNLTAVWAEHNTREAIYDAFRRKETFATSGTRLKVRFFGGGITRPRHSRTRNGYTRLTPRACPWAGICRRNPARYRRQSSLPGV